MSRSVGSLYHPVNRYPEPIYEGWSWPCLFAGCFWFLAKGMLLWAIAAFLLACVTFGISWLVFPALANRLHQDYLRKKGYGDHPREVEQPSTPTISSNDVKTCPICAEQVRREAKICRFCRYEFPPESLVAPAGEELPTPPEPNVRCPKCSNPQVRPANDGTAMWVCDWPTCRFRFPLCPSCGGAAILGEPFCPKCGVRIHLGRPT